jgi:hypothetical protein
VREEERGHLARELHDELGALLTAAKLDVARLKSRLGDQPPEVGQRLQHLTETLNSGIALKRRIIEDLRPSSLSNLGLTASLEILAREFSERSGGFCWCPPCRIRRKPSCGEGPQGFWRRRHGGFPAPGWIWCSWSLSLASGLANSAGTHQVTKLLPAGTDPDGPACGRAGAATRPICVPDTGKGQGWRDLTGSAAGSRAGRKARLSWASSRGKLSRNILLPLGARSG